MSTLVDMAKKATVSEVRAWGKEHGFQLGDRGRLPAEVWQAWESRERAALPQPRTEVAAPAVTVDDLDAARQRIALLERQVGELIGRLATLEQRAAEPRRLFARSR